uniref:SGNH domain-containing protein n=2 Tax=Bursaphelenchus xylophilus TaxID=6326 RepID=A0A1I7RQE1_BURXY
MCLAATISFNSNVQQPQVSAPHEHYTDNITKHEEFLMSRLFDYEHMDQLNMTNTQLADYNGRLHDFCFHFASGHRVKNNETKAIKISHQVEGTGDLEVLLIGNSIIADLYYGLWPRFRSHYKRLTLVLTAATVPFQQDYEGDHSRHFLNIVKNFGRPIDLLVIRYATHRIVDDKNYIKNHMRTDMQYFFDQLSLLPVKKIITGYTEYKANRDYNAEILQKAQRANEDTSKFNFSYKKARERNLPLDKVISTLKCDKCSIYDFSRTFCNSITDKCNAVLENGVMIYWDYMHVSAFGSFFMADDFISYLRRINVI